MAGIVQAETLVRDVYRAVLFYFAYGDDTMNSDLKIEVKRVWAQLAWFLGWFAMTAILFVLATAIAAFMGCAELKQMDWENVIMPPITAPAVTTTTAPTPSPVTTTTQPAPVARPARYEPREFGGTVNPIITGMYWATPGHTQGNDMEVVRTISLTAPDGTDLGRVETDNDSNVWFVRRDVSTLPAGMVWKLNNTQYRVNDPKKAQAW